VCGTGSEPGIAKGGRGGGGDRVGGVAQVLARQKRKQLEDECGRGAKSDAPKDVLAQKRLAV
jgi:hypothetical protein